MEIHSQLNSWRLPWQHSNSYIHTNICIRQFKVIATNCAQIFGEKNGKCGLKQLQAGEKSHDTFIYFDLRVMSVINKWNCDCTYVYTHCNGTYHRHQHSSILHLIHKQMKTNNC